MMPWVSQFHLQWVGYLVTCRKFLWDTLEAIRVRRRLIYHPFKKESEVYILISN